MTNGSVCFAIQFTCRMNLLKWFSRHVDALQIDRGWKLSLSMFFVLFTLSMLIIHHHFFHFEEEKNKINTNWIPQHVYVGYSFGIRMLFHSSIRSFIVSSRMQIFSLFLYKFLVYILFAVIFYYFVLFPLDCKIPLFPCVFFTMCIWLHSVVGILKLLFNPVSKSKKKETNLSVSL